VKFVHLVGFITKKEEHLPRFT